LSVAAIVAMCSIVSGAIVAPSPTVLIGLLKKLGLGAVGKLGNDP
jgi:hypothetical protein